MDSDFTTDDWKWWYDHVLLNEQITPVLPAPWSTGSPRVVMKADFPDRYTAVFTFQDPKPLFAYIVTRGQPFVHAGFMKQFHEEFTDKAKLEADAKAAGFESWVQLFQDKNSWWTVGRPTLGPWMAMNTMTEQLFIMERNPYFWQVDEAGNQLPYIDRVTHLLFEAPDAFNTRIIAGDVDFQARHVSVGDFPLLKENESRGDYQVVLGVNANHIAFQPNHTAKNPKIREFFQNRDVRIALSLAINRDEINELVFNGIAVPRQYSPLSMSPQYYEKLTKAYIEYDPARANQLLDQAGYDKKDAQGFRLWKDGSGPVSFIIEGTAQAGSPDEDAVQTMIQVLCRCWHQGNVQGAGTFALHRTLSGKRDRSGVLGRRPHPAADSGAWDFSRYHHRSSLGGGVGPVPRRSEQFKCRSAAGGSFHYKDLGSAEADRCRTG